MLRLAEDVLELARRVHGALREPQKVFELLEFIVGDPLGPQRAVEACARMESEHAAERVVALGSE